jgi:hypothetical protein
MLLLKYKMEILVGARKLTKITQNKISIKLKVKEIISIIVQNINSKPLKISMCKYSQI